MVVTPTAINSHWGPEPEAILAEKQSRASTIQVVNEAGEDPDEDAKIDAALTDQGYYRDDVPLSYQDQDFLHTAAEEFGVPYELALAVVHQETDFRNVVGDDGKSIGFMQIQKKWHAGRMDELGITDLSDPYGNFRVGCSFLAELIGRYGDLEDALTYYNSGHPGSSDYADSVIGYMKGAATS